MTSIDHLLPEPDQAPRCTEYRRELGTDPGGTAIRADRVVLISTPLPWPKPVFDHPRLSAVAPILKRSQTPTRTLAFVPGPASSTSADGAGPLDSSVVTFDRVAGTGDTVVERRFSRTDPADLETLALALADNDTATVDAMADYRAELVSPVVLVCTQGSHDVCCGSEGARFAAEAEALDQVVTYRVSHTGGHRFAPTAMTLPDGRMWADLDTDLLRQVLARTGDPADLIDYCRGWWGAATGGPQLAERAVLAIVGWAMEENDRTVEPIEELDGTTVFKVAQGSRAWTVPVTAGRTVPTIACRQPGGLPAKSATEYSVGPVSPARL